MEIFGNLRIPGHFNIRIRFKLQFLGVYKNIKNDEFWECLEIWKRKRSCAKFQIPGIWNASPIHRSSHPRREDERTLTLPNGPSAASERICVKKKLWSLDAMFFKIAVTFAVNFVTMMPEFRNPWKQLWMISQFRPSTEKRKEIFNKQFKLNIHIWYLNRK